MNGKSTVRKMFDNIEKQNTNSKKRYIYRWYIYITLLVI